MKKLFFLLVAAVVAMTSCSTSRQTTTTSNNDDDITRTTTSGVNTRMESATASIITTKDGNGNTITMTPLYRGARVQGWDVVIISPDGKVLYEKSRERPRYKDALQDAYNDYLGYSPRRTFWNQMLSSIVGGGVYYKTSMPGTYQVQQYPYSTRAQYFWPDGTRKRPY